MARIRTIKPEFWTSPKVAECSPTARLLFIGLWNFCDDQGIHPRSLKRVKMEVFPGDDFGHGQLQQFIDELKSAGLIREYEIEGEGEKREGYWIVTGWKHQKIDKPSSKYPAPNGHAIFVDDSPNSLRLFGDESPAEGKGRESIGEDQDTLGQTGFGRYWSVVPNKVKRKTALEIWKRKGLDSKADLIIADVQKRIAEDGRWRDGFIPDPPTYLRQERWNDAILPPRAAGGVTKRSPMQRAADALQAGEERRRG